MKNKWKNLGVTYKIFIITTTLLIISSTIIYMTLYFLLPSYYHNYKTSSLENEVNKLVDSIKVSEINNVETILDDFSRYHNVSIIVEDSNENIVYFPYKNFIYNEGLKSKYFGRGEIRKPENKPRPRSYTIKTEIHIQGLTQPYYLTVSAPLQPIDEASKIIFRLMPIMFLVAALVSLIGSYIYSKVITKPLLHINSVAKDMSMLNFSNELESISYDEIGELSSSLNELSINLQKTMDELKQANEKLKSDIEKERTQEANRREFIATISHELKSPITIISGQLEGMIYNIGAFKDRDKYLKQSYDITQEMKGLVNEMLDLSKIESFEVKTNIKNINITNVVEYILENQQYFIQEKNIKLSGSMKENLYVFADEQLIKKAITNVVNNAIKYSNNNETLVVNLYKNESVYLEIENTGAHIEEELLKEVFKPFYRIERSRNRQTGGSGLGLYIVKKILEINNVRYNIENTNNSVKFTMIFPHEI